MHTDTLDIVDEEATAHNKDYFCLNYCKIDD